MRIVKPLLLSMLMFVTLRAAGEIEKFARPGTSGLDLVWWPKLPSIAGWDHDDEASWQISANVLLPAGQTFASSPSVIYANAIYKRRTPSKSLSDFIAADHAGFKERSPTARITEIDAERDGDRKSLPTFSFTPSGKGDWEIVACGEEGDYFLIFVVSARSEAELRKALPTFHTLISKYHAATDSKAA